MPVILTSKGAIDREMFELINYDVTHSASFQSAANRIRAQLYRQHAESHLRYLQFHVEKQGPPPQAGEQRRLDHLLQKPQGPAQFDQLGTGCLHKPYIPCSQYLSDAWLEAVQPVVKWAKQHMSLITAKSLCLGHAFRTAKYVRHADGKQFYKFVLTVYTDTGQVMGQCFTHTTSLLEVEDALKKIAAREHEDSTHLMRRYMRTLVPDHPQNRKTCLRLCPVLVCATVC